MSRDHVELAATPCAEDCAQVGEEGYGVKARAECHAYRAQLLRVAAAHGKDVPEGVRIVVQSNAHDFGCYYDLAVRFDDEDEAAVDFAYWLEENQPERWDAEALVELGRACVMPARDVDTVLAVALAEDLKTEGGA